MKRDTKFGEESTCRFKIDIKLSIFHDTEEDAKFEEKLTCCLKNDMRNFANFQQSTQKFQNWNFDKILLLKVENV